MRQFVLAAVTALGLLGLGTAHAQSLHAEEAIQWTIGCYTLDDMRAIVHAGQHNVTFTGDRMALSEAIKSRVGSGRCFGIQAGSGGLLDMRWEKPPLIWNGIVKLRGMGNQYFYSPAWAWHVLPDRPAP